MATKYPQYKVTQWIDTSAEAMSKPQATIYFGVMIRTEKSEPWCHCYRDGEPLLYGSPDLASDAIAKLRAAR